MTSVAGHIYVQHGKQLFTSNQYIYTHINNVVPLVLDLLMLTQHHIHTYIHTYIHTKYTLMEMVTSYN